MYFLGSGIKQKMFNSYYCISFFMNSKVNTFDVCFISRNFIKMSFILALRFHGFCFNIAFNQIDEA